MDLPAGNSIYAIGGVNACGTRIQKQKASPKARTPFLPDMMKVSADQADPALTRIYVEHIGEDVDWCRTPSA
jgi:fumarate reductase flavoprotein subunit